MKGKRVFIALLLLTSGCASNSIKQEISEIRKNLSELRREVASIQTGLLKNDESLHSDIKQMNGAFDELENRISNAESVTSKVRVIERDGMILFVPKNQRGRVRAR